MKQFIAPSYTFTPGVSGVGTVDLSGIAGFNVKYLVSIINQTSGQIIYATGSNDYKYTNVSGAVVTLNYDTSAMSSGDVLQVVYEVQGATEVDTGLAQGLTDAQLRASAVPVSGTVTANTGLNPLTDAQLRASAVPVSGPLTDAQLRASAIPVSVSDVATESTLNSIKTSAELVDDTIGTFGATAPAKVQMQGFVDSNGNAGYAKLTENDAVAVGNAIKKFRDGFASLAQGEAPDSNIWDIVWNNQGSSSVGRAGNAQGSSYMKISMCPITSGSELIMTTKRSFKFPMRFVNMLSISQRLLGQEFEVSIVGVDGSSVVETLTPKADLTISGTVTIASNVATINFASAHGLQTSDRVILLGNTERRLNVGPVVVTVVTETQITVPCTLANGTYTAGGVVRWADAFAYSRNAAGLLYENTTATNASFVTRRNGFNTRSLNSTVVTTANATTVTYADPFNATTMNQYIINQEEVTIIPRSPDTVNGPGTALKWHQGLPDEELEYKIRIRAKNLDNFTKAIARITAIAKTGTTTATVTTDVAHGLATTDFVQIYGVRDITNFPNLTAQTQVASIVSPTQFTIVIGAAVTASSAGGSVLINQGSVLAGGLSAINVQSITRTSNIITLVGNTTWAVALPGETVHLHGCDATSMGLYDGSYKVLRANGASLLLESVGANFGTINCGGAVIRRTDYRLHAISELEHTRHIVELSNAQGSADASRSIPVVGSVSASQSGTYTVGISANQTIGTVTSSNAAIPGIIADQASGAITSTTTSAAVTPTFGATYKVNIPVTAVSGTNPTLDFSVEESSDSGTNWYKVYDFPRITATGFYQSPTIPLTGNRVRYVQTITGTTPSFTRAINRLQSSWVSADRVRQLIDRTIVLTTLNSTTPSLLVDGTTSLQLVVNIGAATTPPSLQLQGSDDGVNFYDLDVPLAVVASSVRQLTIKDIQTKFVRARVSTAGTTVTAGYVLVKAF